MTLLGMVEASGVPEVAHAQVTLAEVIRRVKHYPKISTELSPDRDRLFVH